MGDRSAPAGARLLPDGGAVAVSTTDRSPAGGVDPGSAWTLTVPSTIDGVATAVSHFAASHLTMGPARSHPSNRRRPPQLAFGDEQIPAAISSETPETGITLTLPRSLQAIYVAAPLAYYLGADVRLDETAGPHLTAPEAGVDHRLDGDRLAHDVAGLLRRCFFMDTLLRDIPGEAVSTPLAQSGLERPPATLRRASPAAQLAAYLAMDDRPAALPEWHLSTYVDDTIERARSLPHLLDSLSLIYPARASELEQRDRLRQSLDAFYRARAPVATVDVVDPVLEGGDLHGWLAPGTPIEAFKTSHQAYEHGLDARADPPSDPDIAVVINDDEMATERAVTEIYGQSDLSVTVHEDLRRDTLAAVFEAPHDFVHYVGHCEIDGLRCRDGHLDAADLDRVRTRTFFLNACGSFHQGRALVGHGATAGAVTLSAVLDEQAATVGTTFARLLVEGFSVASSLDLARRRILMGTDYAVVGDGTATAVEAETTPTLLQIADGDDDRFTVRHCVSAPSRPGDSSPHPFVDGDRVNGTPVETVLDRDTLRSFLAGHSGPVIHEGRFEWAAELASTV